MVWPAVDSGLAYKGWGTKLCPFTTTSSSNGGLEVKRQRMHDKNAMEAKTANAQERNRKQRSKAALVGLCLEMPWQKYRPNAPLLP